MSGSTKVPWTAGHPNGLMDGQRRVSVRKCQAILFAVLGESRLRKLGCPFSCSLPRFPRYSILPALSLDGILFHSIVEGSFNGETFHQFVEELLEYMEPFPGPNSVLVMDNCKIHKVEGIREMVEAR